MQFAISDAAAILFAEELYTNLIGAGAPIDAAVSEARKAIYVEQGTVEWATPVLFMADTDVELFRFPPDAAAAVAEPLPEPVAAPAADPAAPVDATPRRGTAAQFGGGRARRAGRRRSGRVPPQPWRR